MRTPLIRHIIQREWLTLYQLRKVLHGKAAELHLGPYVFVDRIGEGGMGKVYRARRSKDGTSVALKIVRPILLANPVIRKRYEREVKTALTLKHPNIVEVFDAGEIDGRHYLAMEFVDGIDLSRLVKEHRAARTRGGVRVRPAGRAGAAARRTRRGSSTATSSPPTSSSPASGTSPARDRTRGGEDPRHGADPCDRLRQRRPRGERPDAKRDGGRHARLHGSRAGEELEHGRPPGRPLQPRLHALLPAGGPAAVPRRQRHREDPEAPARSSAAAAGAAARGAHAVAEIVARLMARSPADRFTTAQEVAAGAALRSLANSLAWCRPRRARPSGTYPVVPQRSTPVDRGSSTPTGLSFSDDTPQPGERTRRRNSGKETLSSLQEPPSSESFPCVKPIPLPAPESFLRRNRGVLVAIGCWVVAFAIVLWARIRARRVDYFPVELIVRYTEPTTFLPSRGVEVVTDLHLHHRLRASRTRVPPSCRRRATSRIAARTRPAPPPSGPTPSSASSRTRRSSGSSTTRRW